MPLTTTWTRSVVSKCGWALASLTRPWVAQRVWPMPVVAGRGRPRRRRRRRRARPRRSRLSRLPTARTESISPSAITEMPGGVVAAVLELAQARRAGSPARAGSRRSRRCRTWRSEAIGPTRPELEPSGGPARRRPGASQTASASSAVGASTITRTSCSVPDGRTSTRPRPSSAGALGVGGRAAASRRAIAASRSATGTLTSRCGSLSIAVRGRPGRRRPAPRASAARWRCRRRSGRSPCR